MFLNFHELFYKLKNKKYFDSLTYPKKKKKNFKLALFIKKKLISYLSLRFYFVINIDVKKFLVYLLYKNVSKQVNNKQFFLKWKLFHKLFTCINNNKSFFFVNEYKIV